MERAIASTASNPVLRRIFPTGRLSLTARILVVNILPITMLAGGFFYLDGYRAKLVDERLDQAREQIWTIGAAIARLPAADRSALLVETGQALETRFRLYDDAGAKTLDSFAVATPGYTLVDPAQEPWRKDGARFLDRAIDWIVDAPDIAAYAEPVRDSRTAWPEAQAALANSTGNPVVTMRYARDRTPMISAAIRIPSTRSVVMLTYNARDITRNVRDQRATLGLIILSITLFAILMSLFLARTIVKPLGALARAAVKVRLGREREVIVPRLPERRDEIGLLARSLSDMTTVLRKKIDATENFAADVAHELKNPLASLRSALETLERVEDPDLQKKLIAIAASDVRRMDRLITDISDASRVDAQLARTKFELVDLGEMIGNVLATRQKRGLNRNCEIAFARPRLGVAAVMGEGNRLERVINNLLDNAVSFSPPNGLIEIKATEVDETVSIRVIDEGPGVPVAERQEVFRRFHSSRPEGEEFGKHSGLGLAIARTIVEGHYGTITIEDRDDGRSGACFVIALPSPAIFQPALPS